MTTNTHTTDTYSVQNEYSEPVSRGLGPVGARRFAQSSANYYRRTFWVVPGNDGSPIKVVPS